MGQKNARKQAFLVRHPICCFCGGTRPATTIDHQPARALFDARAWPEGYEFPACDECNQSSKSLEHVLAILVRMNSVNETPEVAAEARKFLRAMRNNFPSLFKMMSANEKRAAYKKYGLEKPQSITFSDLPLVGLNARLTETSFETCLQKLVRALHYKHTGSIVPAKSDIFLRWFTNAHAKDFHLFEDFFDLMKGRPLLKRAGVDLSSQFHYIYGVDQKADLSVYACTFRNTFAAIAIVPGNVDFSDDGSDDDFVEEAKS